MRAPMTWRATLPDLLTAGTFRTQAEIVDALERRGAVIDQSAVSRELRRLGVKKVAGCYRMPGQPSLGAPIHSLRVAYGGGLAVLTTEPAFAAVVANAIDHSDIPGVLGTIAGDDTVMVALGTTTAVRALRQLVGLPEAN